MIIAQIASVALCAMSVGIVFTSLGYTPVIGYIIAGIILGPFGFQVVTDTAGSELLAEMGIIFLLFVIGVELSFEKVRDIWKKSIAITLASALCIFVIMYGFGVISHITFGQILLITFCITLSSTAVTVKSLASLKNVDSSIEENTFGILIAQDLIALVMVLILNFLGPKEVGGSNTYRLLAVLLFVAGLAFYFIYYHKYISKLTNFILKHNEIRTLTIFGLCLGGALLAEVAGLSASFGAFIVGLILGNSNIAKEVKESAEPIEEILLMTFFLNVGLLVDLRFVWDNIWIIMLALLFVAFCKTGINLFVLRLFDFSLKDSFVISVLLGHIGEFSFMLAYTALNCGIITDPDLKFLISLTALSLFLSPFWLLFAERCRKLANSAATTSAGEFFLLASTNEVRKIRHLYRIVIYLIKVCITFVHDRLFVLLKKK